MKEHFTFTAAQGSDAPVRELLADRLDWRLERWFLPPACYTSSGPPTHQLAMQISPSVPYRQRVEGQLFDGWMPAKSSWIRPAGTSGSSSWDSSHEVVVLSLEPTLLDRLARPDDAGRSLVIRPRMFGRDPIVSDILSIMVRHASKSEPYGPLFLDGFIASLAAYLAYGDFPKSAPKSGAALPPWQVRRVINYVEDRICENLSLASLAAEVGLSERYFCTAFGSTVGVPPHRYVIERRVARAKNLLESNKEKSITEIAMSVGFKSSAHFATVFLDITGATPSFYRSSNRK